MHTLSLSRSHNNNIVQPKWNNIKNNETTETLREREKKTTKKKIKTKLKYAKKSNKEQKDEKNRTSQG